MGAADHADNHLQEITKIFDNLETKKQLGILGELKVICKRRGILFKDESHLQQFKTYLQYSEDEQIQWLPKENNRRQISNQQQEI